MMKFNIVTIIFVLLFYCSNALYSQPIIDTNNINKVDASGKKQGRWAKFDKGILKYTGQFKNDKPFGTFIYYNIDNKVKAISVYSDNGTIARTTMYYTNGKKSAEGIYFYEKKDSIWNYYDENERLISTETFVKGIKNGVSKIYYPDGNVSEELNWKNNTRDGVWLQYFTNGNTKLSATYKNGKLNGMLKQYYMSGKIKYYGMYVNSKKHGVWMRMNEDGKPAKKDIYKNGIITKTDYYDKTLEQKDKELEERIENEPKR